MNWRMQLPSTLAGQIKHDSVSALVLAAAPQLTNARNTLVAVISLKFSEIQISQPGMWLACGMRPINPGIRRCLRGGGGT